MEEIPIEEFNDDHSDTSEWFRKEFPDYGYECFDDEKKENSNRFVYDSDLGLNLLTDTNSLNTKATIIRDLNSASIRSEDVREFVRERIDFPLTDPQWLVIDAAIGNYWNNRKIGSWIGNEDMAGFIFRHCEQEKMLISWERVLDITNQIWVYLEMKGRLVD